MTSLSYKEIFNDFMGNVTDYNLASLDISEAYTLMTEYLHKALSQTYIRRLFSEVILDDEVQVFKFTMDFVIDESADLDFVKYIITKSMVIEWLSPQVNSKINISQFFGGKEQKFYAQSAHLSEIRGLLEDIKLEVRKRIRDRGYISNSYLGE